MLIEQLARKIPDNVRSQRIICEADPIANAVPVAGNYAMMLLFNVWFEFIEPHGIKKPGCPQCLQTVLSNFHEMKGALIKLEQEYKLLNTL